METSNKTYFSKKFLSIIVVLYHLKHKCPSFILRTLYNTLVLPYLSYALITWFTATDTNLKRIITLQKKVIRIMGNLSYFSHTTGLFKEYKLLKVEDLFILKCAKIFYEYTNSQTSPYLASIIQNHNVHHTYNTRISKLIEQPNFNLTLVKKQSILTHIINAWNLTPQHFNKLNNSKFF